ncbi:MAG: phytanoyl-CoA dioxygenase family protein [Leptospiraceae bacterium]|nr:phytanoyl-CoA dioxygenase family protein [Leptospiraceae bacterium]
MSDFYGLESFRSNITNLERWIEEIKINGFTIIEDVISEQNLILYRKLIDQVYKFQEEEFGSENLNKIKERNMARCLIAYNDEFLKLSLIPVVVELIKFFIGDYFILNLQNAIINTPNEKHHQSSWHRDLPYQNWVITKPIAMNCLITIDPFSKETGSTEVVPFTHNLEEIPSEEYCERHKISVTAPAGSAIVFNSMLFHRAGNNTSPHTRRGVNHIYTVPILKQQIDIPRALKFKKYNDPFVSRFLGFDSSVPESPFDWRKERMKRS